VWEIRSWSFFDDLPLVLDALEVDVALPCLDHRRWDGEGSWSIDDFDFLVRSPLDADKVVGPNDL